MMRVNVARPVGTTRAASTDTTGARGNRRAERAPSPFTPRDLPCAPHRTTAPWPPPPAPGDRYRDVPVRADGRLERRTLRQVPLWGCDVLVDEVGRVHCHGCYRLVDVDELSRPGGRHRAGMLWEST